MPTQLNRFTREAEGLRGAFFAAEGPISVGRAPGWVDLLGGAAAYGGCLALGWPLASASLAAVQPTPEPLLRLADGAGAELELPLAALATADGWPREYAEVAGELAARGGPPWLPLAAGAWLMLMREEFARFPGGARLLLHPADGPGAPASVVAAVAQALAAAYAIHVAPRELALGCQVVLHRLAGRADAALGPMVSVCAPAGELLMLHQQPAWHWGNLHLPHGAAIWALRVGDGPPPPRGRTRTAAAMAYRLVADAAGLAPRAADGRWRGYLASLGTAEFERRYRDLLPAQLIGRDYLARYPGEGQPPVDPAEGYPLRAAAALPVEEHLRARTAVALLRAAASKAQREDDLLLVGELMAQSHWAQGAAGQGDADADALADMVYAAGPAEGLYGARAPAADSGASLVVLGRADAEEILRAIAAEYAARAGRPVELFGGDRRG